MRKLVLFATSFFIIILAINSLSYAAPSSVKHYTLKNGLSIFIKVDKRAPVVISQIWYQVGSSFEPNGITGISHVLEHMMFQGSQEYPENAASRLISQNGGSENAMTSADYTVYYQQLSADKLPICFKIESARMQHLLLKAKDFKKEIKVVKEERRMRIDNNPQALTYERFAASAFLANPYHHPVVGWMNDLNHMNIMDVKAWYQGWYAPNNAVLVVVGDVNPEHVYALAKKYFAKIPAHQLPTIKPKANIQPKGERQVIVNAPANLPWLIMGYNVPSLKTAASKSDVYALEVLAAVMDEGASSRLQRYLVRGSKIASNIGVGYNLFSRYSTLFNIAATPSPKHTVKQLKQAILQQIINLQKTLIPTTELQRVKNQMMADKIFAKDSMSSQALLIGRLESIGLPWKLGETLIENINKVTPEQVQAVAKKYLIRQHLTIGILHPEKI